MANQQQGLNALQSKVENPFTDDQRLFEKLASQVPNPSSTNLSSASLPNQQTQSLPEAEPGLAIVHGVSSHDKRPHGNAALRTWRYASSNSNETFGGWWSLKVTTAANIPSPDHSSSSNGDSDSDHDSGSLRRRHRCFTLPRRSATWRRGYALRRTFEIQHAEKIQAILRHL